jgi:hypothetical protein
MSNPRVKWEIRSDWHRETICIDNTTHWKWFSVNAWLESSLDEILGETRSKENPLLSRTYSGPLQAKLLWTATGPGQAGRVLGFGFGLVWSFGLDSRLLNGCFIRYKPRTEPKDFLISRILDYGRISSGCGLVWYVCVTRVNGTLVHSHQSYLEAITEEELSVTLLGLRDDVPGMMWGLTLGWIGDSRMIGGPKPCGIVYWLGTYCMLGLRVRVVLAFILLTRYRYYQRGELWFLVYLNPFGVDPSLTVLLKMILYLAVS